MEYKEIYDEINTVLWGDEIAKTKEKGVIGVGMGYLPSLYDPCHNSLGKINRKKQERVYRLFKKFADKLYLETKDEYVIKLIDKACCFVGEMNNLVDMTEITRSEDDPEFMFSDYKKEDALEPEPESKYKLISILRNDGKIVSEKSFLFKFYAEAKAEFDGTVKRFKEDIGCVINYIDDPKKIEEARNCIKIDEKDHFVAYDGGIEYILKKYI